ncbi:hypothetical protein [Streptomyces sp. NBC_01546]|uniref:hypothetical protein n=1 Tax=Streptomyces sp. NBC_01546 TaxID=2975872 RepID=UPI002F913301
MADHNDRTPNIPGPRQEPPATDHGQALGHPAAPPLLIEEGRTTRAAAAPAKAGRPLPHLFEIRRTPA